jgi:hypothetical protein
MDGIRVRRLVATLAAQTASALRVSG